MRYLYKYFVNFSALDKCKMNQISFLTIMQTVNLVFYMSNNSLSCILLIPFKGLSITNSETVILAANIVQYNSTFSRMYNNLYFIP